MEDLNANLKTLQDSLHILLKRYKQLQKENEHLKNTNEECKKNLLQKDVLIFEAQQKSAAANLISLHSDDEKKVLQQKIDFYLKDIEKCLSFLNV